MGSARARQASGPPATIDGDGAFFSAVNGPLATGGGFSFEPSSFPPNRLSQADIASIPRGWDTNFGIANGTVYAVAVDGDGNVYVGGDFQNAGGVADADYIARWNGVDGWSALDSAVSGPVYAIAVMSNGDVYVGGQFSKDPFGTYPIYNVVRWNGSRWFALKGGLNGRVNAIAIADNGDVYVGGEFTATTSGLTVSGLARWDVDTSTWITVGDGVFDFDGTTPGKVNALAINGSDLYVGGEFGKVGSGAGQISAAYIARWDGSQWHSMGNVLGPEHVVDALTTNGDELYLASRNQQAGGFHFYQVSLDGSSWTQLASSTAINDHMLAAAASHNNIFIAGTFDNTATFTGTIGNDVNGIAHWNSRDGTWSTMNGGVSGSTPAVHALGLYGPSLYVGGDFAQAGGQAANRIGRWVQPIADLSVFQRLSPSGPVYAGQQVTYTITVQHNGYHQATQVQLQHTLPATVTFASASDGGVYDAGTRTVTWDLGSRASGLRTAVNVVVNIPADMSSGTVLTSVARVEADQYDPVVEVSGDVGTFNTHSLTATVHAKATLLLDKSAPATASAGEVMTYTLVMTNAGPSLASSLVMTDILPAGVLFKAASPGCSGNNSQVICNLAALAVGASQTVKIEVVPIVATQITNLAAVWAPEAEQPAADEADTVVSGTAGLAILKTDGLTEIGLNEPLTYTIQVWNSLPVTATNVRISDTLPGGTSFRSVSTSKGSCSGTATITCDVSTLLSGEFVTVTLSVTPTAVGTLVNTAQVGGDGINPVASTDNDTEVRNVADLQLAISGPSSATAGQAFDYQITVLNNGPAATSGVTLTDDLPDGLYLNSVATTVGTCSSSNGLASALVECDIGDLANGQQAVVTINVTALAPGTYANTARVGSPKADDQPDNNQQTVQTTVAEGTPAPRTVDGLTIHAYVFQDLGGGQTGAYGVTGLGDHFYLAGLNDWVVFGNGNLNGSGRLTLKQGDLPIFSGDFSASGPVWDVALGNGSPVVPHVAGFQPGNISLNDLNLLSGQVDGSTPDLLLDPPGNSVTVAVTFTITPGPEFGGTVSDAFTLTADSFDLQVPAGATLFNTGISASSISLVLPAYFGSGVVSDATLSITRRAEWQRASLELGGAAGSRFPMPDLRFNNQSTLVLTGGMGMLVNAGGQYAINIANSRLLIDLPGNSQVTVPQSPSETLGTVWLNQGQISTDRLPAFPLNVANGTLTIAQALLTNTQLAVSQAVLQWPANLGSLYGNVPDVSITPDGALTISHGQPFALADIKLLGGQTLRVKRLTGTLVEETNGYSFNISSGQVQITLLQQNDHALDLAAATVNVDGHFRGVFVQDTLTLDVGGAQLTLSGLSSGWPINDTTGLGIGLASVDSTEDLSADQATWQLPTELGGGSTSFNAPIVVDGNGLHINNGNPVPFPNATLDANGFPVLNNRVTLAEAGDRTYELNLTGSISVTIPGFSGSTSANLSLDSLGDFSGSAAGLQMLVGGMEMATESFIVEGGRLLARGGTLSAPPGFGGDQITLNGMAVLDADLGLLGLGVDENGNPWGQVELPSLSLNGYDVFALEGSFRPVDRLPVGKPDGVDDGYEITGHGLMRLPGFDTSLSPDPPKKPDGSYSQGVSCAGFEVSVRLIVDMDGRTQVTVVPVARARPAAPPTTTADAMGATFGGLRLIDVSSTLYCSIDIPELLLTVGNPRLNGGWDGYQDLIHVGGGISVWTMMQVFGHPLATGDVDALIQAGRDWQSIDMTGTIKILDLWDYARATGHIGLDYGVPTDLRAELTINQMPWMPPYYPIPMVGVAGFHAWTDWSPARPSDIELSYFHLTGWASLDIELPEGIIWTGCVGMLCATMPPFDIELAGVGAEFGEFRANSDSVWGFKAQVSALGLFETGLYIDADGKVDFGDVDGYVLIDSGQLWLMRQAWLAANGLAPATAGPDLTIADFKDYNRFAFAPDTITRTVPVTTSADLVFALVRDSAVPTLTLVSPSGVSITPSTSISGVLHTETYTQTQDVYSNTVPLTQTTYIINKAEVGDWQVVLHGNITADDHYMLSVIGAAPSPTLADVTATSTGPTTAQVGWSLAADNPNTVLNIHATTGPIRTTMVVTGSDGITETVIVPTFTGTPVAEHVPTPLNGAPTSTTVDLSSLSSGTYWIWVEANDLRNSPIRVYAPDPVVVDNSATWPVTWTPNITVTADYLGLQIAWDGLDHPDVNGYTVYVSDSPLKGLPVLSSTLVITTPYDSTFVPTWLTPQQTYHVAVEAFDSTSGRRVRSQEVTGTPYGAQFTLSTDTPAIQVVGGSATTVDLTLTRTGDMTPTVGLYAGVLPDGLSMVFANRWLTPTLAGTPTSLVISATDTMPGGVYTAAIAAFGGGGLTTLDLQVTVNEPTFELAATPDAITLNENQSGAVTISATGFNGESDPIHLEVTGAPPGLLWDLSNDVVYPSGSVTLAITDTLLVGDGRYALHVAGNDGENEYDLTVTLNVVEPRFGLTAEELRREVRIGNTAMFTLDVTAENGWGDPVTLKLVTSTLPPASSGGLALTPAGTPLTQIVATPPQTVYLSVATGAATPTDLYLLTVDAQGGAQQTSLGLELLVSAQTACTRSPDVNSDGGVDIVDVQLVAGAFGLPADAGHAQYDLDCSGEIGVLDILVIASAWGQ